MPSKGDFLNTDNPTLFKTPNGKHLKIVKITGSALFGVRFEEGGELPKELTGMWTDAGRAYEAIKLYLDKREAKASAVVDKLVKEKKAI